MAVDPSSLLRELYETDPLNHFDDPSMGPLFDPPLVGVAAAKELSADRVVNYHDAGSVLGAFIARMDGHPFANVIEASGSPAALDLALNAAAQEGKVLIVGDYREVRAGFAWSHLLHREWELIGSNGSAGAWDAAVELAVSGVIPLERLISHRLRAEDYARGIELARSGKNAIKVLLNWQEERV
jgi:threonine dehydrogenase-like Zn-dependent dehydrogenase